MYDSIDQLIALAPQNYLMWQNFATSWDSIPLDDLTTDDIASIYYKHGLEIGQQSREIHIRCNGTWAATGKDGSLTSSYEVIGYHVHTMHLLHGFLDSLTPILVYRYYEHGGQGSNKGICIANSLDAASKGHLFFHGDFEYFRLDGGSVRRALRCFAVKPEAGFRFRSTFVCEAHDLPSLRSRLGIDSTDNNQP